VYQNRTLILILIYTDIYLLRLISFKNVHDIWLVLKRENRATPCLMIFVLRRCYRELPRVAKSDVLVQPFFMMKKHLFSGLTKTQLYLVWKSNNEKLALVMDVLKQIKHDNVTISTGVISLLCLVRLSLKRLITQKFGCFCGLLEA